MRTILDITDELKTRCLAEHHTDTRAHHAFGYAIDWLRVHPPREHDDPHIVAAHCRRAVDCRGRNEQVMGEDGFKWDDIARTVAGNLIHWIFLIERREE